MAPSHSQPDSNAPENNPAAATAREFAVAPDIGSAASATNESPHAAPSPVAPPGEALAAQAYVELLAIARRRMRSERAGHTLQATALVNEAWLRLCADGAFRHVDKNHFLNAAAEAMRRILIDYARSHVSLKRGGGKAAVRKLASLDEIAADLENPEHLEQLLSLDDAISRLEKQDSGAAAVVRLRFFAGLSNDEAAAALGVSLATVKRDWQYARAWLYRELSA